MSKTLLLATTAILLSAGAASAQTSSDGREPQAAQAPAPTGTQGEAVDAAQRGVLVFTPDFFTEYRPNTALDMVNRVPGFGINDGAGSRGFEGAVGNVLINNARPASKNDTGSNVLSRTVATQVERIELIRGGAPGIDMQGYSVVVNVILKTQSSRQQIITAGATLFEGGRDMANGSYQFTSTEGERTWGVTLSDGLSMSDSNGAGRSVRTTPAGVVLRDEAFYNDQYGGGQSARVNYAAPFFGGKIDLTARYGVNDYQGYSDLTTPTTFRRNSFVNDGNGGEFGAVYTRPLGDRLKLETRFIHQFNHFESTSASNSTLDGVISPEQLFDSAGDSSETILRSLLRFEKSEALTFETGAEIAYNMLETDQAFSIGGVAVPLPSASVKVEETRGEAFGKATWRIDPNLSVEGGLRLEASTISQSGDAAQEESFFFAKPRLLMTWTPMENNQIRVRFERELGQLDFSDFAASADLDDENVLGGNIDLKPEQRWISEVIYERRFWKDGIVSVGYRHDQIIDAIDVIPLEDGLSAVGNIGDATLDQLAVNMTIPMDRFGFSGGKFGFRNTWNHTEVTDPTSGETRRISNVRPSQAVISLSQDITTWKINWSAAWIPRLGVASYDPDQTTGFRGTDYFELVASYKPTPTLTLTAQMNIWDDFQTYRTAFADRGNGRPIAYTETRDIDPRTFYRLSLRKTF
ncbi:TonB-dependent receptor plug domain-containing protein [Brevundimonas sp. NPDC092305]|uniref:TonB-dependent receptor plug domain-containing protein n=1 Tax=Brevundimonas sp. NPDC092305 TaxID=3363957 RepID=UPI00380A3169